MTELMPTNAMLLSVVSQPSTAITRAKLGSGIHCLAGWEVSKVKVK